MSWDVLIVRFSRAIPTMAELSDDDAPLPIGVPADVQRAVSAVFAGTDWSDEPFGTWESEHGSIEFQLGDDDPAENMTLHVRATPEVIPRILDMCDANSWQAIDTTDGEIMARGRNPERGLEAWLASK